MSKIKSIFYTINIFWDIFLLIRVSINNIEFLDLKNNNFQKLSFVQQKKIKLSNGDPEISYDRAL